MTALINTSYRKFNVYKSRYLKSDLIAAIVVFLVAIPLCLGIALASNAPLFSGLLGGIIGGIVVGIISKSQVSVSGPAAGMVAVVVTAISQIGDFQSFLLALTLAGMLQVLIGIFKAGFIAEYVPSNVVQGLLCAIGILLIIKQLPMAFTHSTDLLELKAHLLETTEGVRLQPLYDFSKHINEGAVIITLISFTIMISFDKIKGHWIKSIPAPIIVVIAGILLNEMFTAFDWSAAQDNPHLVNIPEHDEFQDFINQLQAPNWNAWTNPKVYIYAFIIAIVASLESLLNVKAGEKLDPRKRITSKDRELLAQGTGNILAGLLGAIPITSVIVRTSVNIQAGSQTKFSCILHGILLLLAVTMIPGLLNKIPLSSLAAILIFTGYKLTNPNIYKTIYKQGLDRFIPFIATVVGIVIFNLLAGVLIGLGISLFYILKTNSQSRLDIIKEIYPHGVTSRLVLPQQITFLNKASLIAELESIPKNSQLIIDAHYSKYIDKEIVELINEFKNEQAPNRNISLNLIGFQEKYDIHNYIDFINVTTFDVQSKIEPHEVLSILREGNQRFMNDTRIHRSSQLDIKFTAKTQHPIAVVLACIDSRVPVETIFDVGFGDLFCIRIAGNVVNNDILASMEYACRVIGAKLVLVLGHARCGAISAACDGVQLGHISQLLAKINPSVEAEKQITTDRNAENPDFVLKVTHLNISNTIEKIYQDSPILQEMINQGEIGIAGALYNVETGQVQFDNYQKNVAPEHALLAIRSKELIEEACISTQSLESVTKPQCEHG